MALLPKRLGRPSLALTPPFGRPFSIGNHRLELFPSGSAPGAASLLANISGHRVVYSGPIRPSDAEVRTADTLIIDAEYGAPRYEFPDAASVTNDVSAFCAETTQRGGIAVLLVRHAMKALEVTQALRALPCPFFAHRTFHVFARRGAEHLDLPPVKRARSSLPPSVLLWPTRSRTTLRGIKMPPGSRIALVSGRACDTEWLDDLQVDNAFPWSDRADFKGLLGYVDASGAKDVYATGLGAGSFLEATRSSSRPLGPPQQMALF